MHSLKRKWSEGKIGKSWHQVLSAWESKQLRCWEGTRLKRKNGTEENKKEKENSKKKQR